MSASVQLESQIWLINWGFVEYSLSVAVGCPYQGGISSDALRYLRLVSYLTRGVWVFHMCMLIAGRSLSRYEFGLGRQSWYSYHLNP